MRAFSAFAVLLLLAGCGKSEAPQPEPTSTVAAPATLTPGETRSRIAPKGEAAAIMRSGAAVPVSLPPGFTLYPGAKVISNTLVTRGGKQRTLLVFETSDPIEKIMLFYRAQAQAAGVTISLDLSGDEGASLGGLLPGGGELAITARPRAAATRVELAAG